MNGVMNAIFGIFADVTERPAWQTLRTMAYYGDRDEFSSRTSYHYGRIMEERARARRR